jgi:hypothetical protein
MEMSAANRGSHSSRSRRLSAGLFVQPVNVAPGAEFRSETGFMVKL